MKKGVLFSEVPGVNEFWWVVAGLIIVTLLAMTWGGFMVTGIIDSRPASLESWQQTHDQTYEQYVATVEQDQRQVGAIIMGGVPTIFMLEVLGLRYFMLRRWIRCSKGHLTKGRSDMPISFCVQCGIPLYAQNELSPDEWKRRYEEAKCTTS